LALGANGIKKRESCEYDSSTGFFQQLSLAPLTGAIAAGNCCVVKPSELAPKTAEAIARLVAKYLDPDCYAVFLVSVA
jgi:acyl-CoA reductase-like NAD-dependent aldehyde dehydrogenase